MSVQTHRKYADVTLPGASAGSNMLRAAVGQDDTAATNTNLPLEKFVAVEDTGVGHVSR